MAREKIVITFFARKDEQIRNLLTAQKVHPRTPFKLQVGEEAYDGAWKPRLRARIRGSDDHRAGLVVSPTGQGSALEIERARTRGEKVCGFWIEKRFRNRPRAIGTVAYRNWTYTNAPAS